MSTTQLILAVGSGGCAGALLRLAVSEAVRRLLPEPWWFVATTIVNLVGCFAVGILATLTTHGSLSPVWSRFLVTGLLGSLTTFSAFGFECVNLTQRGRLPAAGLHVAVNVVIGFALVWCGVLLAETMRPADSSPALPESSE